MGEKAGRQGEGGKETGEETGERRRAHHPANKNRLQGFECPFPGCGSIYGWPNHIQVHVRDNHDRKEGEAEVRLFLVNDPSCILFRALADLPTSLFPLGGL